MATKARNSSKRRRRNPEMGHDRVSKKRLDKIYPSPENDTLYRRVDPDDPEIKALADSILQHGICEPLVITLDHFLLSGHRRRIAAELAGLTFVPVRIERIRRTDDINRFVVLLREFNRQRDKTLTEKFREEIVTVDPNEAYQSLITHREDRSRVHVPAMKLRSYKKRCQITKAKKPFLDAVLDAIWGRKEFWPLSVRTVHYALQNDPPLKHASKPCSVYRNDLKSYKSLDDLLTRARLDGSVPWESIGDETRPVTTWNIHSDPRTFIRGELDRFCKGYWRDLMQSQPNHIEIVCEKNTVEPILRPVAMEYTIPLTSGRGYCSLSPRKEMADRFEASGKDQLVILFLADFDADGIVIAESFARSMRDDFDIEDIVPIRVGLNRDQIDELDNPPKSLPPKKKSANYKAFVAEHGRDCWELEAIPPTGLQQYLRSTIDSVIDTDAFNAELDTERDDATFLQGVRNTAKSALQEIEF